MYRYFHLYFWCIQFLNPVYTITDPVDTIHDPWYTVLDPNRTIHDPVYTLPELLDRLCTKLSINVTCCRREVSAPITAWLVSFFIAICFIHTSAFR